MITGTAMLSVSSGTNEKYTGVTILPSAQGLSASGQTGQFVALATSGTTGLLTDVTNSTQIKWSASIPTIATVSAAGLAQGVSPGTTNVTVELTNPDGTIVSSTATINVTTTAAPEPLLSLTIIPDSLSVGNLQDTGQFLAIGTFSSAPYVRDLTNSVAWLTSVPNVFPVTTNCNPTSNSPSGSTTIQCATLTAGSQNGGVVSAYGSGNATIIAEATAPDGSIQTATATFACPLALPDPNGNPPTPGSCYPRFAGICSVVDADRLQRRAESHYDRQLGGDCVVRDRHAECNPLRSGVHGDRRVRLYGNVPCGCFGGLDCDPAQRNQDLRRMVGQLHTQRCERQPATRPDILYGDRAELLRCRPHLRRYRRRDLQLEPAASLPAKAALRGGLSFCGEEPTTAEMALAAAEYLAREFGAGGEQGECGGGGPGKAGGGDGEDVARMGGDGRQEVRGGGGGGECDQRGGEGAGEFSELEMRRTRPGACDEGGWPARRSGRRCRCPTRWPGRGGRGRGRAPSTWGRRGW